jgi:hypothetical protein
MVAVTTRFRIEAIPAADLRRIRESGRDDAGNPLRFSVTEGPGSPLRCCLREATSGERIALITYRPFTQDGPYAEVGPVFIHADECAGYESPHSYPEGFRNRRQVFRPYDAAGNMVYDALALVDGDSAEETVERLFARPDVEFIHSRNPLPGCYMFRIARDSDG